MPLRCVISSPEGTAEHPAVRALTFVTPSGEVEILPGHAEAFFVIAAGDIRVVPTDGAAVSVAAREGVCHVAKDEAIIVMSGT